MPNKQDEKIDRKEFRRAATELGLAALRVVVLINGGAAIAVLAFIGSIMQANNFEAVVPHAAISLGIFCTGLFLAATTAFCGWRSQDNLARRNANTRRGNAWLIAAGSFFALSALVFPIGAIYFCCSLIASV